MQRTAKPTGLKKIWREIKRPFNQGWRFVYFAMLRYAYRKAAKKREIVLSQPEATERVFINIAESPEFLDRLGKQILEKQLQFTNAGAEVIQNSWNEFFKNPESDELNRLRYELTSNTDKLSCEVVDYFIARRLYSRKYTGETAWRTWEIGQRLISPLLYEEQNHIELLAKQYRCPYVFPGLSYSTFGYMATHFGFKQLPAEIQERVVDRDVIDGGGWSGDSAMVFTEYNPRKVYAFEPNPDTIPAMKKIILANEEVLGEKKDRIEIVPLALSQFNGTFTLYSSGAFDDSATTELPNRIQKNTYEVKTISIDEFVQEHSLNVGLIKLDIEGAEYGTILGAKDTITSSKPILLISIYHNVKDFFEIKPMIQNWNLGYQFTIRRIAPWPDAEYMLIAY